jgi:hypothetical protein
VEAPEVAAFIAKMETDEAKKIYRRKRAAGFVAGKKGFRSPSSKMQK